MRQPRLSGHLFYTHRADEVLVSKRFFFSSGEKRNNTTLECIPNSEGEELGANLRSRKT